MLDMAASGLGGALGNLAGLHPKVKTSPYDFMTPGGKQFFGDRDLAGVDSTTVEGLRQQATMLQKMGRVEEARAAMDKVMELEKVNLLKQKQAADQREKDRLVLSKGQEEIAKNSTRSAAAKLAMQQGDETAHKAIVGGFLEPEKYIASVMDAQESDRQRALDAAEGKTDSGYTLGPDQVRFDSKGNVIARGPEKTKGDTPPPVYVERASFESTQAAREASIAAGQAASLVADIDQAIEAGEGPAGGALSTGEEAIRRFVGSPDAVSDLKIRYYRLRNSDAVANLPPGPASDPDVQLALQGWPGDNAPLKQVRSFLRGMQEMQEAAAEYHRFTADYIGDNRTTLGASRAWRESKTQESSNTINFADLPKD
jgi:hypothetical protein